MLAITRMRPVCGSMATIAPFLPARALSAAFCPPGSRVVTTSRPSRSWLRSWEKIDWNSFSSPASGRFSDCSSPRRPLRRYE